MQIIFGMKKGDFKHNFDVKKSDDLTKPDFALTPSQIKTDLLGTKTNKNTRVYPISERETINQHRI